jgi:UDP-N-acetylglucosamine 1-carboxyvinyltransferase
MSKEKFIIEGFSGKKRLKGRIKVKGSKNAILPAMASSVVFSDPLTLNKLPKIEDVSRMEELLKGLGATVRSKNGSFTIDSSKIKTTDLDEEISKRMRASIVLSGPLLARFGKVSFPHPGGCVIGERPIDMFLQNFIKMGAKVKVKKEIFSLQVSKNKLQSAEIFFRLPSVSATETFLLAAILAEGKTILRNSSMEPEIISLGEYLISCGAKIKGLGTTSIEVEGGKLLKNRGKIYKTIPDRLETGSFLILGALASNNLIIEDCEPKHVEALTNILQQSGVAMKIGKNKIKILKSKRKNFKSFSVKTHEYPGFPTDLQAPIVVFLTQAEGEGLVFETIFESRLNYINDLIKMGADITMWDSQRVAIKGSTILRSRELEGPDIRAGLAFVIAAIVAKGRSIINNVYYVDRGYEKIEERLRKIGVKIKRVSE